MLRSDRPGCGTGASRAVPGSPRTVRLYRPPIARARRSRSASARARATAPAHDVVRDRAGQDSRNVPKNIVKIFSLTADISCINDGATPHLQKPSSECSTPIKSILFVTLKRQERLLCGHANGTRRPPPPAGGRRTQEKKFFVQSSPIPLDHSMSLWSMLCRRLEEETEAAEARAFASATPVSRSPWTPA